MAMSFDMVAGKEMGMTDFVNPKDSSKPVHQVGN
jgi:hypothetical protein